MAVDMFLKVDGIDGESEDSTHKGEIQILGWAWGAAQVGTAGRGGGQGAGKVEHDDIEIIKLVDRASSVLYLRCCDGKPIPKIQLTVRKAGGDALEYLVLKLEDVIVTSFKISGEPKQDQVVETLRLNFSKAVINYTPQGKDGSGGAAVIGGWDLGANKSYSG